MNHDKTQQNTPQPQQNTSPDNGSSNWYAKLHPIGTSSDGTHSKKSARHSLNLSLFFRIWLAVALIICLSGAVVFIQLFDYVRPVTQQVIEDTLVDTAKLLAVNLEQPMRSKEIYQADFQARLDKAFQAQADANLKPTSSTNSIDNIDATEQLGKWYQHKTHSHFRVYITDNQGKVIYDSSTQPDNAEGEDYQHWNDVYLTLNGQYGARTTRLNPDDSSTSVMYVAQPIKDEQGQTIGVVSVGKPMSTILPYINITRQHMLTTCLIISLLALILAGLVAWWLQQSMRLVTRYTQSLAQDEKKPYFYLGRELNELTDTIEEMKHRLENRAYVTDYVHTLTHELKSPITAIRACGELLEDTQLEEDDRLMLSQTISEQSIKLQSLIDRLLLLAKIEQPTFKLNLELLNISALVTQLLTHNESQRLNYQVAIILDDQTDTQVMLLADNFWLTQALQNILDNALYFAHSQIIITLQNQANHLTLTVFNNGELIPEYALSKVFERYFSLSHQHISHSTSAPTGKKGTGLGLTLVKQVIERHGGQISIHNVTHTHLYQNNTDNNPNDKDMTTPHNGVMVVIELPINPN
ncbi:two-component system sensor histidine kinase CreC [Psychrobacter sp. I-STPA6b]|uniref:two-component system sensor histidine kinase CreC n=2 Tax=Pseudomonadati TaxID=3379134 RepID=UPI001D0BFD46|nr:two-component system sensor histidine kinase CreC [Psychrobacter sp. I-STPA6b]